MRNILCLLALVAFSSAAFAQTEPSRAKLGEKMPNFTFKDDKEIGRAHV